MTLMFPRPIEGPPLPSFNLSKKSEHHFGAEGNNLEECYQLRDRIQDLIDNKLIQFNNAVALNIITKRLPPYLEERVPDFSLPSFPWKTLFQALVQESHLDLEGIGTPEFDWGIYSFCDCRDKHALFDCKVLLAQIQSLADCGIIWLKREVIRRGDCMVASLCPPAS